MLSDLINEGFKVKEMALLLNISERTVYRRLEDYDLKIYVFSDISDELLDYQVKELS